jgi:hypothetical protein
MEKKSPMIMKWEDELERSLTVEYAGGTMKPVRKRVHFNSASLTRKLRNATGP